MSDASPTSRTTATHHLTIPDSYQIPDWAKTDLQKILPHPARPWFLEVNLRLWNNSILVTSLTRKRHYRSLISLSPGPLIISFASKASHVHVTDFPWINSLWTIRLPPAGHCARTNPFLPEMVDFADPLVKIRVTSGTCSSVAILTTLHRIFVRARRGRRLWFDDMWAILSMCSLIVQMIATFIDPDAGNKVVRYYLMSNSFYAIIWSARLSILFSIIRIDIKPHRRRILIFVAALFILTWFLLTAQVYWECESSTTWKKTDHPRCNLSHAVGFFQLGSDIISDSVLLFVPIRLFMLIGDKRLRYCLMVIFGTCIITTTVSFVHTAYMLEGEVVPILISAIVENAISLIVCNIPTMVTSMFELRNEDTLPSSPDGMPTLWTLTTATSSPATTTTELCLHKAGSEMSAS